MPSCSVKSCKNNYRNVKNSGIRLHRFPRNKEARQKWGEFCSRKLNFANARICSVHFDEQCYERKPDYLTAPGDTSVLRLKETAVPTKLLYEDEAVSPKHEDNKGLETRSCVVFGCGNNSTISDPSIDYYAFPKNELSQEWATACGWQSTRLDFETAYVCSMHFEELDFEEEITILDCMTCYSKKLKEDAVPTLCLPLEQVMVKENPLELQTQDMLVYTIDSSNIIVKENSTTMSLESASGNQQIFELGAFSSEIKAEEAQVKSDIRDPIYGSSKSFSHLYCLQEDNESLKRTVEVLQEEVDQLQKKFGRKKEIVRRV
ncbi:hypothetical protein NQ315_011489 [Exocentrus adspersus]|uniref:THAP-type domain-containing protein n=1 Tax=Exocentrus adspersus TaxID=1586481 RepID=A0AAV8VUY0_9CUCU|nr:hypothetical protein NQ315_011489 [Exocentrus adspersus]